MRLVCLKLLLLSCIAHYAGGLEKCPDPRITYMNHTTAYEYTKGVRARLRCGLTGVDQAQLMWWRSREPCGPFMNDSCPSGTSMCAFDIVDNMDYLYYCCTAGGTEPSSAASGQLYCLQVMICPAMSSIVITQPPVAFFEENLTIYVALDASPKVLLTATINFPNGRYENTTIGKTVPSDESRPRLLYEFKLPLPQSPQGGMSENAVIRVHGTSACETDINKFLDVFVTNRDQSSGTTPSTLVTNPLLTSTQLASGATEGMPGSCSQVSSIQHWRLAVIILSCVVVLLILLVVLLSLFYCFKYKSLATTKSSGSSYNIDGTHHVQYNPLGGLSRENSVPSEQIAMVNGAENPVGTPYGMSGHKSETSPPAYQDLMTPDRSRPDLSNLTTSSPTTIDQRLPLSTLPEESPTHLQNQSCTNAATPTSARQPPLSLAIQPSGLQQQQHLHTGETPLMGFDTPLNVGSQDPFAQQFAAAATTEETTDHVYAKPDLLVSSRHASRSSGPSEVGSPAGGSGSGTILSAVSGRSLVLGDGGSVLSGGSVMAAGSSSSNMNTNLYSSERIRTAASQVNLSNDREMDSVVVEM